MFRNLLFRRMPSSPACPRAAAAILLSLSLLAVLLSGCAQEGATTKEPTTVTVEVAPPLHRSDVVPYVYARGMTKSPNPVDLYCRVSGYLQKVRFTDGEDVPQDKVLFQIDDAPFKAAVKSAEANLKIRIARSEYCAAELKRNMNLPPEAISKSELEKSKASKDEADAAVDAATADLEKANLDLKYTSVLAPVAGRMSKAAVTEGNLVVADKTFLSNIVTEEKMYVEFYLDEQTVLEVQQDLREGRIKTSDDKKIPVAIRLGNESGYTHEGEIDFFDNRLNANTGTYLARAVVANTKPKDGPRLLLPGMSVDVRMPISMPEPAILVAERAIGSDLAEKYVYVLNDKNQAEKRMVELGTMSDGLRVVKKGLAATDQVIVVGQQVAVRPNVTIKKKEMKMSDYVPAAVAAAPIAAPEKTADEKPQAAPASSAAQPKKKGE